MLEEKKVNVLSNLMKDILTDEKEHRNISYVFVDPEEIQFLFQSLKNSDDMENNLKKLLFIVSHQTISVNHECMLTLLYILNPDNGLSDIIHGITLKLILELITFKNNNIAAFFALPDSLQIISSYFPLLDSAKIVVNIMNQIPSSIDNVLHIFSNLTNLKFPLNPNYMATYMYFYPKLFKVMNQWSPIIEDFIEMLNNVIINSDDENLIYDSKSALKKIVKKYKNAAELLQDKYPLYCNFDPTESLENVDTIKILSAAAASLNNYSFIANEKILNYLHLCLTTNFDDGDDLLLFFTLDFFLQSKDYSGLYEYDFLYKDLVQLVNHGKYKIQVKIIEIICRFLMVNNIQILNSYLKLFQVEILLDFLEDESNTELQISILECLVSIKSVLHSMNSNYIDELINNNNNYDIIENIAYQRNDNLSSLAKLLL